MPFLVSTLQIILKFHPPRNPFSSNAYNRTHPRNRRVSQARPQDAHAGAGGVSPCRGAPPPGGGGGPPPPNPQNQPPTTKAKPATDVPIKRVLRTRSRVQGVSPPAGGMGAEPPTHETSLQTQKHHPPPSCQSGASAGRARGCRGCLPLPGVWGQSPHFTSPTPASAGPATARPDRPGSHLGSTPRDAACPGARDAAFRGPRSASPAPRRNRSHPG